MLLSTFNSSSHRSKTTYLGHDPSLASGSPSSPTPVTLHTPPSAGKGKSKAQGKPRVLSTVLEAPTPVANSPEPGAVPSRARVPVRVPVPVPVPPRVSSAPEKRQTRAASTKPGTTTFSTTRTTTTTNKKLDHSHRRQSKGHQNTAPKGGVASSPSTPSQLGVGIASSKSAAAVTSAALPEPAPEPAPLHLPVPVSLPVPASNCTLASASSRRCCLGLASHDSFLDKPTATVDASMADNRTARTPPRDSHDLSLSPRDITRDSLVVNMLLSLDQMSFGQSDTDGPLGFGGGRGHNTNYDEEYSSRPWTNDSNTSSQGRYDTGKHRHWHQSSYSSDMDSVAVEEPAKQSTAAHYPPSRGRRSNSSSNNFQGQFPRLNSMRETSYKAQPGTPPRSSHTRGGRQSNKSSSSASIDMGYPHGMMSHRLAQRTGRSASFDYGPQSQSQLKQLSLSSPFQVNFPDAFSHDDDDAAPTPTVPGGPRRDASSRHIPPPPPQPVEPRTLERKRSTSRSLKSSSGRSRRGTAHQGAAAAQAPPPMPTQELESAPAPSVGYGKSKESDAPVHATSQPKERPGFFRRVFGSSKSTAPSNGNLSGAQTSSSRLPASPDRSTHQQKPTTPSKPTSAPPSRDTASSHSHHQPTLQKKSSSFFRRRKKSFADEAPPVPSTEHIPPVPVLDSTTLRTAKDDPSALNKDSPASSLRQVMNPYLRESVTGLGLTGVAVSTPLSDITNTPGSKSDGNAESRHEEYKREFSPDYEPSPNARIRRVSSGSDGERFESTPSRPKSKHPQKTLQNSNSFLDLDAGSDNDEDGHKHKKSAEASSPLAARAKDTVDRDATIRAKKKPVLDVDEGSKPPAQTVLNLPADGGRSTSLASGSTETGYRTAPSAPPSVLVQDSGEASPKVFGALESIKTCKPLDEPEFVIGEPTEDDRQKAQRIFDGGEEFIQKDRAAAWMGEQGPVRQRTLQAYMELYDFTGLSILAALRQICGRLVLRAETQQVDRILVAFSKRWCNCNPNHGFKATDVIHMICYSIMLLNTDLHLADIESKMTRSQFIKNTMTTITQAVTESAPEAFVRPTILPDKNSMLSSEPTRPMTEPGRSNRHSFRPTPRTEGSSSDVDDCGPLVTSAYIGPRRGWEEQIEIVLKSIYASIRDQRLPLFGAEQEKHLNTAPSQSSLSVMGMLKRSPSVLSKAPSETISTRGRVAENSRNNTSRWTSKSRSRPGLGRTGFSSSRTSFDDGNSMWSPAMSSATWSKHSLGRTQGSMSQDSFASSMPRGDYQQSIGFANALSQAIIRDEDPNGHETAPSILSADLAATQFLEDESLELAGPPWVKEGMVMHKHHLDGYGKRAKDRNWTEVFAVVQKGQISLFSFNASKSMRQKSRSRNGGKPNGPVGGGNWQDNAVNLGTFNLRLTLASALPSPGYSRSRPHVWALSLPTGAVHLFHVGTPEIIREFVNTANYWSARLSTHPLVGGISNIEYGWSDAIVNNALVSAINESATSGTGGGRTSRPGSSAAHGRKSSAASGSFRASSFDQMAAPFTNNSGRGKLPGDRIHIADWAPPTQSMRPSNATESEQLETLTAYVKSIGQELEAHNQLRSPMLLAFTPRGHNAGKAMANWERKSAYLLREIVKFRTYVDCLQQAEARKREIYSERDLAQKAARGDLSDGDMDVSADEEGDETLRP